MIDFGLGACLDAFDDEQCFLDWRNDPKIWRWTRQNDLLTKSSHDNWFQNQGKDPSIKMYKLLTMNYLTIGACGLTSISLQNRNAEFSLYIAPKYQGNSLAIPALKTLFYHGFKNMGLKSIWGETFENNPAQDIFSSIGMRNDGKRRQFYWKDGKFWDAILFSILDHEFLDLHGDRSCF